MNYDTKLELRMVDPKTNRVYYTEPFELGHSSYDFGKTIEAFSAGCEDAKNDIERDIERSKKFGMFTDWDLATELAARGYDVQKRC